MLLALSLGAAVLVALYALYGGYFRSGAYLTIRAGCGLMMLLLPGDTWHLYTAFWWLPLTVAFCRVGFGRIRPLGRPSWSYPDGCRPLGRRMGSAPSMSIADGIRRTLDPPGLPVREGQGRCRRDDLDVLLDRRRDKSPVRNLVGLDGCSLEQLLVPGGNCMPVMRSMVEIASVRSECVDIWRGRR